MFIYLCMLTVGHRWRSFVSFGCWLSCHSCVSCRCRLLTVGLTVGHCCYLVSCFWFLVYRFFYPFSVGCRWNFDCQCPDLGIELLASINYFLKNLLKNHSGRRHNDNLKSKSIVWMGGPFPIQKIITRYGYILLRKSVVIDEVMVRILRRIAEQFFLLRSGLRG